MIENIKQIAEFYKALGDETRLKILEMLTEQEMCVCEIIDRLDISQPAVSHHLKILRQAGLVRDSREGKWIYYSLNGQVFKEVFGDGASDIISTYAVPIQRKADTVKLSRVRTNPELCEKLIKKQGDGSGGK